MKAAKEDKSLPVKLKHPTEAKQNPQVRQTSKLFTKSLPKALIIQTNKDFYHFFFPNKLQYVLYHWATVY